MTRPRHASPRGIVRDRDSDIEYGTYLGPPIRVYERQALDAGETALSVEEWDCLATDNPTSTTLRYRAVNATDVP